MLPSLSLIATTSPPRGWAALSVPDPVAAWSALATGADVSVDDQAAGERG